MSSSSTTPAVDAPSTITRPCPVCGSEAGEIVAEKDGWFLRKCADCGMVYMPVVPSAEALEGEFEWEASFKKEKAHRWKHSPIARSLGLIIYILPGRDARAQRRILRDTPKTGKLVDIGGGRGRLAAKMQEAGWDVSLVELSPGMANSARQKIGDDAVLQGRLEDFSFEPDSIDCALMISFLEHEPAPLPLLQRVQAMLKPGGVAVIKVPNYACGLHKLRGKNWSGYRWPEHVNYFTPTTLSDLLNRAGLNVHRCEAPLWNDNMWVVGKK